MENKRAGADLNGRNVIDDVDRDAVPELFSFSKERERGVSKERSSRLDDD